MRKRRRRIKSKTPVASVMSVNVSSKEFRQSTARSTIRERCESIFNQELLSNVKFVIRDPQGGSEGKKIPAHKFVLAISSPVFYAMFYGELAETKDSVEVSDCDYESLLEMFRFIYSDEANVTSDNVMQLMYLAKKYMLPLLADKCSAYLQENLDASSVFPVLSEAQKYEEKDLVDHCWKIVEKETKEAVKSDGFLTIERSVLEELVNKESLNIKEIELFEAVDRWAERECEKQGVVPEGSEKRRILGERVVKAIRFPVMELKEFASVVLDCGILTQEECFEMVKYFSSVISTPVGFSDAQRAGYLSVLSRFRSIKYAGGWHYCGISNALRFSVDKNITLHSVRLFGSEGNEYSVELSVYDANEYTCIVAVKSGKFLSKLMRSEIGNYQGLEIVFEHPISLKAKRKYKMSALISGPPSWYGEGGQSSVQHSEVKFQFWSIEGGTTNVTKGQFPELVFVQV